ncbi:glycosyltransferase [Flavobacterium phycosphaerae]|uniref:glycosyltransferase n=1 Tax=Flavobacterium phycosphaerae TaxID=2697515 RepID=UPI00138A639D|nr:glycosyltransferase [Flavobacterium phycosphaerae]
MIKQNKGYKVALIGDSFANGGAEKVHALLSVYFQESGFEVHNCIFADMVVYDYSGTLVNLGTIHPNSNAITRKVNRFFALKKFIKEGRFDAVIDFRMRTGFALELLLSKGIYPQNTFYTVHSGILDFYFPKSTFLARLIYKKSKIVAVSKAIQQAILDKNLAQKVNQIYNPVDLKTIDRLKNEYESEEDQFILAIGRMNDEVKQFDKLIVAYSQSVLPDKNIKLIMLGEGKNQAQYKALSQQLGLEDKVVFKGFVANPFTYYQKALFTVLSSKNEGFPNVIIESLAVGTPVLSFDCFSGPNEIIVDKQNGLLIENQNFDKLSEAMNLIVEDENLYQYCKQNAKASVAQFDIEIIGKQWTELLKNTVS